jgi:VCBS repeat-containing protein
VQNLQAELKPNLPYQREATMPHRTARKTFNLTALAGALLTLGLATNVQAADFAPVKTLTTAGGATDPTAVASGDLNGDGIPDLVVANNASGQVTIFLGQAGNLGAFGAPANVDVGINGTPSLRKPAGVAIGDVVGDDGFPDIVVAVAGDDRVTILPGDGSGTFSSVGAINLVTGDDPRSVTLGDVDNDGDLDIIAANFDTAGAGSVSVFINDDGVDTFSQPNGPFASNSRPFGVTFADATDDTIPDIVVTNFNATTVSILAGANDGTFAAPVTVTVGSAPHAVAVGDVNGDGHPDLAVANSGSGTVSVLLSDTVGGFQAKVDSAVGTSPRAVAIVDVGDSADVDLVVVNAGTNNISVLVGDGTGAFPVASAANNFAAGTAPTSLAVADFDGDGKPDVAVANEGAGSSSVSVLINDNQPVAGDDAFNIVNGSSNVALDVLANDSDADTGDTLTITSAGPGDKGGTITINGTNNGLVYTPAVSDDTETFSYTVEDQFGYATTANVTATIGPNQAPANVALSATTVNENAANNTVVGTLSSTEPDTGDSVTYSLTDDAGGRFKLAGGSSDQIQVANGSLLDFETATSHNITVQATDTHGGVTPKVIAITVTNVNEAPAPTAPAISTDQDTDGTSQIAPNDPDAGDSHTYTVTAQGANGTAAVSTGGLVTYTPNPGYSGPDSVTVTVTDSGSLSAPVTIGVTVDATTPGAVTRGGTGGGGCSLVANDSTAKDPLIPALLLTALVALFRRNKRSGKR